jgi:N-acetylglucosamine kinase-like BadF-type ATPase
MPRKVNFKTGGLVLIADAGATRTRAYVANGGGGIVGRGVSGPGNAFAVGWPAATANLAEALERALEDSSLPPSAIAATVVGSASIDKHGEDSQPVLAAIRSIVPSRRIKALGDMHIALEGALGGGAGVVIVSGTGSVVFGRNMKGATVKVGGWGAVMGDEGSAQWIARHALVAAAHAVDGTGPHTQLVSTFLRRLHARSFHRIVGPVYQDMTPRSLGSLAPLVAGAARRGDRIARDILQKAGEALAEQAAAAIRRLRLGGTLVSCQGSVFDAGGLILNPLRRALKRLEPEAKIVPPLLPPIGGAWLIALKMLNLNPARAAIAGFRGNCHDAFESRMGKR